MAGIGFKLQRLLQEEGDGPYRFRAYTRTSLTVAGPWLLSAATMAVIGSLIIRFGGMLEPDRRLFVATVAYCFIFSHIISASWQLAVMRFVTDRLHENQPESIPPAFIGVSKLVLGLSAVAAFIFFYGSPLPFVYKLVSLLLFLMVGQIWLALGFLAAFNRRRAMLWSFMLGSLSSIAGIVILTRNPLPFEAYRAATNSLLGFTLGIAVALIVLAGALRQAFPSYRKTGVFPFLRYADKYPSLLAIGTLYNVGIWAHAIIVSFGPAGIVVANTFRYNPLYHNAVVLSYLTMIPSVVLFAFSVETHFYDKYKQFYDTLMNGGTLDAIERAKTQMTAMLRRGMLRLAGVQGTVTLLGIVVSDNLLGLLRQPGIDVEAFRMNALGAALNSLSFVCILLLVHLENRKDAVIAASLFCGCNLVFTTGLLPLGTGYDGLGYLAASLASFAWSGCRLLSFLRRIEKHTLLP